MKKNLIIIFAKYPSEGKVKTRLAAFLGAKYAVKLYKSFTEAVVKGAKDTKEHIRIEYAPKGKEKAFKEWLGENLVFRKQDGEDIGKKMYNAFVSAFNDGFLKVILIGTDIPEINSNLLKKAFYALRKNDAVIGPAEDGGYYLIGFNKGRLLKEAFIGIPWSSKEVFKKTLAAFKKRNYSVGTVEKKTDIDTFEDLQKIRKRKTLNIVSF